MEKKFHAYVVFVKLKATQKETQLMSMTESLMSLSSQMVKVNETRLLSNPLDIFYSFHRK